jgi:hypothetical protein
LALQFVVGAFLTVLGWCLEKKPKVKFSRLVMRGVGTMPATS